MQCSLFGFVCLRGATNWNYSRDPRVRWLRFQVTNLISEYSPRGKFTNVVVRFTTERTDFYINNNTSEISTLIQFDRDSLPTDNITLKVNKQTNYEYNNLSMDLSRGVKYIFTLLNLDQMVAILPSLILCLHYHLSHHSRPQ